MTGTCVYIVHLGRVPGARELQHAAGPPGKAVYAAFDHICLIFASYRARFDS